MFIAKLALGHAGQPGYAINPGDAVRVIPADNLPQGGYFIENEKTGESVLIDYDELSDFVDSDEIDAPVPEGWDCIEGDDEPEIDEIAEYEAGVENGDWTTDDGCKFYRREGGRVQLVLDATDMSDAQAERAAGRIMRKEGFFPNIWHVSDHGNVSVFTF